MKLVIVESPGKIKTIQNYLGKDYKVVASMGHIIDLPAKSLSLDVDNDFEPTYKVLPGKELLVKNLKDLAKKSDEVILAADRDREGEMIAWSLMKTLNLKNYKRIVFGEITKNEILKAVNNPEKINLNMVDAQKTRRITDRIVGYYLSPVLWKNVQAGLSAGRVQSVVVRLILERENEIKKFLEGDVPKYYRFTGAFVDNKVEYKANLYDKNAVAKIESDKEGRDVMKKCTESDFIVKDIKKTTSTRNPGRPFTTSTLQQEAGRKLGFNVKRTMMAAQNLYEAGYITYMRTDSVNLSQDIINSAESFIKDRYGKEYHEKRIFKSKGNTQEAHEAVRPSKVDVTDVKIAGKIKADEKKLYSLIWRRTVASQMAPAKFDVTTLIIDPSKVKKYDFRSVFNNLRFPGFMAVYNLDDNGDNEDTEEIKKIKLPKIGDVLTPLQIVGKTDFKSPPSRYDEPSLVSELDPETGLNIGRPATYSSIITKIQDRKYVEFRDNDGKKFDGTELIWNGKGKIQENKIETVLGNDKNRLTPTALGELVTEYLIERFPDIMSYEFTSKMEDSLDDIAEGKLKWVPVVRTFHDKLNKDIERVKKEKSLKDTKVRILGKMDGIDVYVRFGKYGAYVQLGDSKIKKGPVAPPLTFDSVTLKDAEEILKYPKFIGKIGMKQVLLKKGKYGTYINIGKDNIPIDKEDITIEEAKEKLKEYNEKKER